MPLIRAVLLLLLLYGYMLMAEYAGGFVAGLAPQLWLEAVLALYLYALCYSVLRPSRWRSYIAAVPLLLLYLTSDIFYLAFGKVFRLVNLHELPELLDVLPPAYSLSLALLILLPVALLLVNIAWQLNRRILIAFSPILLVLTLLFSVPGAIGQMLTEAGSEPVKYSDAKSVESNGRLTMMLYRETERLKALDELAPYRDRENYQLAIEQELQQLLPTINRRNVHLIVLESFLDPRLFSKLGFSESPVHPEFEKLFGDTLGLSLSPVFGGATAQAEFEVLCGVPALEKLSSVEFNVFNGSDALCLPGQLARLGYFSSASNTYKPNFFNAAAGYQGAGFSASYFPAEFTPNAETYLEFGDPGVEEYTFDSDLFEQNLTYVKTQLHDNPGKPLFNYLLTIYGHTPHLLDPDKRPERIELVSDYADDHLSRAANQFYYRSGAIADYVKKLSEIDPDSLVILISDHVPPLRNGPNTYRALAYMENVEKADYYNRLVIIDRGEPLALPLIHHYEVPAVILNRLSEGAYCRTHGCSFTGNDKHGDEERLAAYLSLMAHASE